MLTLFSECHFWTLREEVRIESNDYGAFRYERSRDIQQSNLTAQVKRAYIESRSGTAVLRNNSKESGRLKDNIKKLEELLHSQRIVCAQWQDAAVVFLLFSNGLIAYICVDVFTGDILRMVFEKYFVGKLAAEVITDAFFTRSHIVLAYNTNQLTVVHLQKPNKRSQGPEKITNMDPRIFHVLIPGPSERKLSRHLAVNSSFDLFVIWTKSSQNEVYPWRPTLRDQDRANINVFKLKGSKLESVSYCWTENDPLCVDFLRSTESQILTVEQKVSRKGEIFAEICSYEINTGKMHRTNLTSIAMGSEMCCYAFSPDQEKLCLGTNDRLVCLHDLVQQSTKFLKQIDIIPAHCSWHSDSSIVMIANDRSQFQCFDLALASVANQLQSEDIKPSIILDLAHYFTTESRLLQILFSRKPDLVNYSQAYAQTDSFLLVIYENGPLSCLRFFAGAGMKGDIHNSGLTADVLIDKYLGLHQLEKAVNLLVALNWETYGAMCLISLHKMANYVFFRSDSKQVNIELMIKAFKTFGDTLSEETKDEFSDQIFDLKRRFFFFLLRNNCYTDAFEVAQDIEDYDLFMDLFNTTKADTSYQELTASAFNHAAAILEEEDHQNGNTSNINDCHSESSRSQSPCSDTATAQRSVRRQNQQYEKASSALKNYVPPLPSLKSKVLNAGMIKINIPKPELRNVTTQERTRPFTTSTINHLQDLPSKTCNVRNLSRKVNALQNGKTFLNENTNSNKTLLGNENLPDKNTMIPTVFDAPADPYTPSTAHNILPRASTAASGLPNTSTISPQHHRQNFAKPHPFATPALPSISSETSANATHRIYQQNYQPKFYQHPLVSRTIPPTSNTVLQLHQENLQKCLQKKPSASILSNGTSQNGSLANGKTSEGTNTATTSKDGCSKVAAGEKNKVKFSDTVQVAVVPEIPRKDKPILPKRNGCLRPPPRNLTNPKKELADSLPLCHPNDDYLKDFNPLSKDDLPRPLTRTVAKEDKTPSSTKLASPSIKVVHFGVV